ncbi:MAG: DUF4089 domain-containing protein [Xanthobacteraceae bacterium]
MGKKRARPTRKAPTRRVAAKSAARRKRKTVRHDELDYLIMAAAGALDLSIDPAWHDAIKSNLTVALRLAAQFADFPLPDEADPAPVFSA